MSTHLQSHSTLHTNAAGKLFPWQRPVTQLFSRSYSFIAALLVPQLVVKDLLYSAAIL